MIDQAPQKLHQAAPRGTWVQTERAAHEAWASLIATQPRAAQLLHILVANMDERGALVASHGLLAQLADVSVMTVRRAIAVLGEKNYIQTIRVGGERGGVLAYVVNSRIAWADNRKNLRYAAFNARVLVSEAEQAGGIEGPDLVQLPIAGPDALQSPHGDGLPPPTQPPFDDLLPDLPAITV